MSWRTRNTSPRDKCSILKAQMQVFGSLKPAVIRSLHASRAHPDGEAANNRKWRLLKGTDVLGIRY